jgi:ADP-heptose:LPS heptosyltransferase
MALLSMLGIEPDDAGYELHFSAESAAGASALLGEHGVHLDREHPRLIGIQAGCHYSMWPSWLFWNQRYKYHKTWPRERWVELAQALHDQLDARIVITGAGAERRIASQVAAGIRARPGLEPINAVGRTRVGELAALLSHLDLFISIDTGSMHMSSALGVPTVALFGPTDPRRHGPYSPRAPTRLVTSGIACSPCKKGVRKSCPANLCMTRIPVDQVVRAARELLPGA